MLTFDMRDFERAARNFDALLDQVPFALAGAMNDAVEEARDELIKHTWPENITARNRSFLSAALTTKGNRATKRNLRVAIEDRLGRASLSLHADGGEKTPKGKAIAVPMPVVAGRRGAAGVPKGLRPRAIPNSFVKGNTLYQRVGTYQKAGTKAAKRHTGSHAKGYDGRSIRPMYRLAPSVEINPDVPFQAAFERAMWLGVSRHFGPRLMAAMKSRR